MDFKYPNNDFDRIGQLRRAIASFWNNTFTQNDFIDEILFSKGQVEQQTVQRMQELFDSVSRFKVPVFHKDRWYHLRLLESDRNTGAEAQLKYGDGVVYDDTGPYKYGDTVPLDFFAWDAPASLKDAKVITNRITDASLSMTRGVDFLLSDQSIIFRADPFEDALVAKRDVIENNVVVDREIGLWVFHADFDLQYIYEQFGYVLQLVNDSSQEYKDLVNAAFDALVEGTHIRSIQNAFEALSGTKLVVNEAETVEVIREEPGRILVITDKEVYFFHEDAQILVTVGQEVAQGEALADTLQFFEFNRGQTPTAAECPAVVLGKGFLTRGFFGDLVFENKDVPLVVTTDADGFTELSWEIGGFPGDVTKFFDDLHARGLAQGQTLANLLDERTNQVGEPGPSNLPETINPLEFLCENVFRSNAYMVKVQTGSFGPDAVGMNSGKVLRKIHPPQTAIIIAAQLEHSEDPIIMDGPGTAAVPGYEESVAVFNGLTQSETIGVGMVQECVRVKLIAGRCV